jgi:hypothetical protein
MIENVIQTGCLHEKMPDCNACRVIIPIVNVQTVYDFRIKVLADAIAKIHFAALIEHADKGRGKQLPNACKVIGLMYIGFAIFGCAFGNSEVDSMLLRMYQQVGISYVPVIFHLSFE